jgi:hypothetical protein
MRERERTVEIMKYLTVFDLFAALIFVVLLFVVFTTVDTDFSDYYNELPHVEYIADPGR